MSKDYNAGYTGKKPSPDELGLFFRLGAELSEVAKQVLVQGRRMGADDWKKQNKSMLVFRDIGLRSGITHAELVHMVLPTGLQLA